jgi:hypothetical protein
MNKLLLVFSVIIVFPSCQKTTPVLPPLTKNEISGERLWRRITVETNYDTYPEWPGFEGLQIGQSPHGRYHEIYINRVLRDALPVKNKVTPDGSILVKVNYDEEKQNVGYTVMAKVKGYNPAAADWFWAAYTPEGKVKMEGKPDYCVSCHEGKKPNDYIIVRSLDEPLAEKDK